MATAAIGEHPKGLRLLKTALGNRKTAIMLVFGFAAGLPYTLLIGTLNAWLGEWEIDLATIGVLVVDRSRLCVQVPMVAIGRSGAPAGAGAARTAAKLADRLPGPADIDLLRPRHVGSPAGARLVRAGGGHRRVRFGDAGRRDRCMADRRRRREGAGRNPLIHLSVRIPYRGADRRRAGARPVRAGLLADGLRDHGRVYGADRDCHPDGARHAARGRRAGTQRASPRRRDRAAAAGNRPRHRRRRLAVGDLDRGFLHGAGAHRIARRSQPAGGRRLHQDDGAADRRRDGHPAGHRRGGVQLAEGPARLRADR